MLDSTRLLLHAFLALPVPAPLPQQQLERRSSSVTVATALSSLPFANKYSDDDVVENFGTSLPTTAPLALKLRTLFAATSILMATTSAPGSVTAMTGTVVEGPSSNAAMLQVTLQPGEKMVSDANTLLYMSDGISFDREFRGDPFNRIVQGGGSRLVTDVFSNNGNEKKTETLALAPALPSRIIPVQLEDFDNTIIGNVHSFLAAPYSVNLDFERTSLQGPKLFNLLRMERVTGKGTVYLTGSGNIIAKQLQPGEKLKLFPGAWVAMTDHMKMDFVKGRSNIFAGSLLEVEGPGTIWIDTSPISRIVDEIDSRLPHRS